MSILDDRQKTHGDYRQSAALCQTLKAVLKAHTKQSSLSTYQMEALEMILFKISRAVCGDSSHVDHWRDIAGYATLVVDELEK